MRHAPKRRQSNFAMFKAWVPQRLHPAHATVSRRIALLRPRQEILDRAHTCTSRFLAFARPQFLPDLRRHDLRRLLEPAAHLDLAFPPLNCRSPCAPSTGEQFSPPAVIAYPATNSGFWGIGFTPVTTRCCGSDLIRGRRDVSGRHEISNDHEMLVTSLPASAESARRCLPSLTIPGRLRTTRYSSRLSQPDTPVSGFGRPSCLTTVDSTGSRPPNEFPGGPSRIYGRVDPSVVKVVALWPDRLLHRSRSRTQETEWL